MKYLLHYTKRLNASAKNNFTTAFGSEECFEIEVFAEVISTFIKEEN